MLLRVTRFETSAKSKSLGMCRAKRVIENQASLPSLVILDPFLELTHLLR